MSVDEFTPFVLCKMSDSPPCFELVDRIDCASLNEITGLMLEIEWSKQV